MGEKTAVEKTMELPHRLSLPDRRVLKISGVTDVDSFDDQTVCLVTSRGALTVSGRDLHIEGVQLETGDMRIRGEVAALTYTERETRRGLFGRLFR